MHAIAGRGIDRCSYVKEIYYERWIINTLKFAKNSLFCRK
jgi:hypothetical protein